MKHVLFAADKITVADVIVPCQNLSEDADLVVELSGKYSQVMTVNDDVQVGPGWTFNGSSFDEPVTPLVFRFDLGGTYDINGVSDTFGNHLYNLVNTWKPKNAVEYGSLLQIEHLLGQALLAGAPLVLSQELYGALCAAFGVSDIV